MTLSHGHLRLEMLILAGLFFSLVCTDPHPASAEPNTDLSGEELRYDPKIELQTNKIGAYTLQIGAIPTKLLAEVATLNGAQEEFKREAKLLANHKWVTPGMVPGGKVKEFTYAVLAGDSYDPSRPAGILVGISAGGNGNFLHKYKNVISDKNLIVIGSNQSGNNVNPLVRQAFAIYAVELIKRRYKIDTNRIYITGGSGGGKAASITMYYRPDLFKGGMPMIGCLAPVKGLKTMQVNGKREVLAGLNEAPSRAALNTSKSSCRYAFLTGEKDFNRQSSESTAKYMQNNGYKYVTVLVQPKIGHDPHSAWYFRRGLRFLDKPLVDHANGLVKEAKDDQDRGRMESAIEKLESALPYLLITKDDASKAAGKNAQQQIEELIKQYDADVAVLDKAIEAKDATAAAEALRDLQRAWRDRLGRDAANEYRKQILEIKRGG